MSRTINTRWYAIAIKRNMYQPDYAGKGSVDYLRDPDTDGGYNREPLTWDTIEAAQAHIDTMHGGVYYTSHNEAGRPDMWIVPADVVGEVQARHEDISMYDWPDDCCTWECGDGDGGVCGSCRRCLDFMASQDEQILRSSKV